MSLNHALDIASQAIHLASITTKTLLLQNIDKGSTAKDDASPVTIADFASQAILISLLRHHFPDDGFVGEESASVLRADADLAQRVWQLITTSCAALTVDGLPSSLADMLDAIDLGEKSSSVGAPPPPRTWVLDPIDGTASFIQNRQYAVSIALVCDGEQHVGVVGLPNLPFPGTIVKECTIDHDGFGTLLAAVKGHGAHKRQMTHAALSPPAPLRIPPAGAVEHFTDSMASPYIDPVKHRLVRDRLGLAAAPVLDLWAMQVKYAALALGAASAMIRIPHTRDFRPYAWDHAGGMLVYEEAGGRITDLYGRRFDYGSGRKLSRNLGLVAARPDAHGALMTIVQTVFDEE